MGLVKYRSLKAVKLGSYGVFAPQLYLHLYHYDKQLQTNYKERLSFRIIRL